jgi:hypothetical protein
LWKLPHSSSDEKYSWNLWKSELNIQSAVENNNDEIVFSLNTPKGLINSHTFAAKLKIWSGSYGNSFAYLKIFSNLIGKGWWTICKLGNNFENPSFECSVETSSNGSIKTEYWTKELPVEKNIWYDVRIEISPDSGALQFYLDNNLLGTYLPSDAQDVVDNAELLPSIGITSNNGKINASFDDIRINE